MATILLKLCSLYLGSYRSRFLIVEYSRFPVTGTIYGYWLFIDC